MNMNQPTWDNKWRRRVAIGTVLALTISAVSGRPCWAGLQDVVGLWQLDGDLTNEVTDGDPLDASTFAAPLVFSSGPINSQPAMILDVPPLTPSEMLTVTNPVGSTSGGTYTNDWSLAFDVNFPSPLQPFSSLLQTNVSNTNDEDIFIRGSNNGIDIGAATVGAGEFVADTWYRIVVTASSDSAADTTTTAAYKDGVFLGTAENGFDGTFGLEDVFHLFADNSSETAQTLVNSIAYWGEPLGAAEIGALGPATADGIDPSVSVPALKVQIDRDNRGISLLNDSGLTLLTQGYTLTSANGTLDSDVWRSIAENADADSGGSLDADNRWIRFTAEGSRTDLSEGVLGTSTLADETNYSFGSAWIPHPNEDAVFEYLDENGTVVTGLVEYVGNDGNPFLLGDLNFDNLIDSDDWQLYLTGLGGEFPELSIAEAYVLGDLDGDLETGQADLLAFQAAFDAANGEGAFVEMLQNIPEPASAGLMLLGLLWMVQGLRQHSAFRRVLGCGGFVLLLVWTGGVSEAATYTFTGLGPDATDWVNPANWSTDSASWTWPNQEFGNEYTNQDADQINVTGFNVTTANNAGGNGWLSVDGARDGSNTATMTVDNSSLTVTNSMWLADSGGTKGTLNVINGSTLDIAGQLKVGDDAGSVGEFNIADSTVTTDSHLIIANRAGSSGSLTISNSTLTIGGQFYMNDGGGEGSMSEVVMDSGTVTTGANTYFNDDAGANSNAMFTMNGGTWTSGGTVDVSWNLDGFSQLIINNGDMTASTAIRMGVAGGGDTGQSRIFLSGGSLQGEDLQFNMNDSLIVYNGGELRVRSTSLSEAEMAALIGNKINASGAANWGIGTDGDYTVLYDGEFETRFLAAAVDRRTGAISIENPTSDSTDINYYEIRSEAGSMNLAGWNSLDDQNIGFGDGIGENWDEGQMSDQYELVEAFWLGSTAVDPSQEQDLSLGSAFTIGATEDLEFFYAGPGGALTKGNVRYYESTGASGDFNRDGMWDCADIDALTAAVAASSTDLSFDMNGDGVISAADITDAGTGWLAVGGANNVADTGGNAFLVGDATLDGSVDVSDFNRWNGSKFNNIDAWCSGDFNANGRVDVSDFNLWNGKKFQSSDGVSAVPEPGSMVLLLGLVSGLLVGLRARR